MWKFQLLIVVVFAWTVAAQEQPVYLTTFQGWGFFKVRVTRGAMTNANVQATCAAAGMKYPCHQPGTTACNSGWAAGCIAYDDPHSWCYTQKVLSLTVCGIDDPRRCPQLDDTFVCLPGWLHDSAWGVDYDTTTWDLQGAYYYNLYAICAVGEALLDFPCMNGGTLVNFVCQCPPWATGYKCETDMIDECVSSPCLHGTCEDQPNHYTCRCHPGWTGVHCETDINECHSSPCPQNATCIDHVSGYSCQCAPGWTGNNCQTDIDECSSSPCPLNSTCVDLVNDYACQCAPGWTGKHCETDIDDCASGPCLSGGTCVDHVTGYSCVCPPDTTGNKCETALYPDKCYRFSADSLSHQDASTACTNMGGHLADVRGLQDQQLLADLIMLGSDVSHWTSVKTSSVQFVYSDGSQVSGLSTWMSTNSYRPLDVCVLLDSADMYRGTYHLCTEEHNYVCESYYSPCQPGLCQNGGNCASCFGDSHLFCDCLPGYTGSLCETEMDECASSPCRNGGTCVDEVNSYSCTCDRGYTGDHCELDIDLCNPNPCPYNWVCVDYTVEIHCEIPTGMSTRSEYCTASSCGPGWYCQEGGPTGYSCIRG
ncbi:PREDICTED: fibropellin-1-like [Branchiostoma belcheri]|uniref:Fibropellin-1-like n=1 Tax=Branchiostoma belcheri TaxID=7741 RepID=A0A6P4XI35_BRABE|nr:PREDICTED: fibropellin-1-like [Branchiostoma belcheri]